MGLQSAASGTSHMVCQESGNTNEYEFMGFNRRLYSFEESGHSLLDSAASR